MSETDTEPFLCSEAGCAREFASAMALLAHSRAHRKQKRAKSKSAAESQEVARDEMGRAPPHIRREGEPAVRLARPFVPNPQFGERVGGYTVECQGACAEGTDASIFYGATAGTFVAECEACGSVVSFPAGSLAASTLIVRLAGKAPERVKTESAKIEEERSATTEDEAIAEVADSLRDEPIFGTRDEKVRDVLGKARKKSKGHPDWTEARIVAEFWDVDEQGVLNALRDRGVALRSEVDGRGAATPTEEVEGQ